VPSTAPSGTSKAGRHAKACGARSRRCRLAETTEAGDIPSPLWPGSSTSPRQAKGHAREFNAVSETGGEMRATTMTGHAAANASGSLGAPVRAQAQRGQGGAETMRTSAARSGTARDIDSGRQQRWPWLAHARAAEHAQQPRRDKQRGDRDHGAKRPKPCVARF
jgi:hypothetical protein